jgi:hypothetical protein
MDRSRRRIVSERSKAARHRVARWLLLAPALGGLLFHFAACGDETQEARAALGGGCLINTDCSDSLVCVFRRCHQQCKTDKDCAEPLLCKAGEYPYHVCDLEEEVTCAYNSDCPTGQVCGVDLHCRDQCATPRDCIEGQECPDGTCANPRELVDGVLVAKNGGEKLGWPCLHNSDCDQDAGSKKLVCHEHLCAEECKANSDCQNPPFDCDEPAGACLGSGGFYCFPNSVFQCTCDDGGAGTQYCLDSSVKLSDCDCSN